MSISEIFIDMEGNMYTVSNTKIATVKEETAVIEKPNEQKKKKYANFKKNFHRFFKNNKFTEVHPEGRKSNCFV